MIVSFWHTLSRVAWWDCWQISYSLVPFLVLHPLIWIIHPLYPWFFYHLSSYFVASLKPPKPLCIARLWSHETLGEKMERVLLSRIIWSHLISRSLGLISWLVGPPFSISYRSAVLDLLVYHFGLPFRSAISVCHSVCHLVYHSSIFATDASIKLPKMYISIRLSLVRWGLGQLRPAQHIDLWVIIAVKRSWRSQGGKNWSFRSQDGSKDLLNKRRSGRKDGLQYKSLHASPGS